MSDNPARKLGTYPGFAALSLSPYGFLSVQLTQYCALRADIVGVLGPAFIVLSQANRC